MCGIRVFRGLHLHELSILFSFAQVTSTYPTFLSKVCFVRLLEFIFVLITLCLTNIRFKCTITTGGKCPQGKTSLNPWWCAIKVGVCWAPTSPASPRCNQENRPGSNSATTKSVGTQKETHQALPSKEFRTSCSQGAQLFLNIFSNKWDFLKPFITMATKLAELVGVLASINCEICLLLAML